MTTFNPLHHQNPQEDCDALRMLADEQRERMLGRKLGQPIAVELGAWAGQSTLILAQAGFRVFAIDHWSGAAGDPLEGVARQYGAEELFATFCRNMGDRLLTGVFPMAASTNLAAAIWPKHVQIDLLFIDADHSYDAVRGDIDNWTPFVRPVDGLIVGHDFGFSQFPGVEQAVRETGPFEQAGRFLWYRRKAA